MKKQNNIAWAIKGFFNGKEVWLSRDADFDCEVTINYVNCWQHRTLFFTRKTALSAKKDFIECKNKLYFEPEWQMIDCAIMPTLRLVKITRKMSRQFNQHQ